MIGNAHRANPLSHALRRASSPERGSFFVWRQGLSYPFCEKKWLRNARRRFGATNYNNIFSAVQAFSEGLLRSTLRMILRTGRMLLAFMDSSSTPMRRKVSVRAVSAPSSPQMPTQMPWR